MEKKNCFKCGEIKPLSEFYKHKAMKDGHVNKCKECNKVDVRENRGDNIERIREYDRMRNKTPERRERDRIRNKTPERRAWKRANSKERGKNPEVRAMRAESTRKNRAKNKGSTRAHSAVIRAIKKGTLIRPVICSRCPATENIQAHHDDHEKPLDVMWLCPICHAQRHVELGKIRMIDD